MLWQIRDRPIILNEAVVFLLAVIIRKAWTFEDCPAEGTLSVYKVNSCSAPDRSCSTASSVAKTHYSEGTSGDGGKVSVPSTAL